MKSLEQQSRAWSPSARNNERARRRQIRHYSSLDDSLFSFAAVFLVLLIIMMVAQWWRGVPHRSGAVNLAKTSHSVPIPNARREDAMNIAIQASGTTYFGDLKIAPGDLPEKIREGLQNGAERRIYLYVDDRVRYSDVKQVIDEISLAGVTNVTFVTQTEPSPSH
jgi:biopolymer transport protein ExbD